MNPRQIGLMNQRKTVKFVLENFYKYGVIPQISYDKKGKKTLFSPRVYNVGVGHFHGDIFDLFDIQTMPDSNEYPVYLIQVKSGSFKLSNTKDLIYYNDLCEFTTPDSIKKELHIWQKGAKLPIILPC